MPQENPRGIGRTHQPDSASPAGKSWFFGIGIDDYPHWPTLKNAVKDVQDIAALLQQQYDIDQTLTLFNEEATRDRIVNQLDALCERIQPADKLLLYFSGHGHLNERTGKGYWVPYDAPQQRTAKYIRNSTIKDYLQDIGSKHTLLISDACFSGSLLVAGTSKNAEVGLQDLERWRSRWAMCSGRHDEKVYDGEPGANSPFAQSILKVLGQQDRLLLNAMLLADQVYKLTAHQYEQRPRSGPVHGVGDEGGQYVFRLRQSGDEAFEAARRQDTIAAYSAYRRNHPTGKHAREALQRIMELEEDHAWQRAQRLHRISAYYQYLDAYPDGRYRAAAHQAIEELEQSAVKPVARPTIEKPTPASKPLSPESAPNTYTDPRDGRTYRTVQLAGLTWLAENLNYDVGEGCWYYDDDSQHGAQYGRLYTWEAAKQACPPGWRLPTDGEWDKLRKPFGSDSKAYKALIDGGSTGFSARLGGRRSSDGSFGYLGRFGSYWSATERGSDSAWSYYFSSYSEKLGRNYNDKSVARSCRCIQD